MQSGMYLAEIKSFADVDVQILPCTFQNEMPTFCNVSLLSHYYYTHKLHHDVSPPQSFQGWG